MTAIDRTIQAIKDDAEGTGASPDFVATSFIGHIANHFGIPVKVWSRGDLEAVIDTRWPDLHQADPARREALIDEATLSGDWQALEECTDADWARVDAAVDYAIEQVEHEALVAESEAAR